MKPRDGRKRVVIEDVTPQIDAGSHAVRRVPGEEVVVHAAIFADGHDVVSARVLYRHESESHWRFVPMQALENDLWKGAFAVIRQRDRNAPDSLAPLISSLNKIRRENRAVQSKDSLHFHSIENPNLICYSKSTPGFENTILVAVNIDPFNEQSGWTSLDLDQIGICADGSFLVKDLLSGAQYTWWDRNYVALRPGIQPAHIFRVSRMQ